MGIGHSFRAFVLLLTCAWCSFCFAESDTALDTRSWPSSTDCTICIPVQFGLLEMQLPLAQVGKILVAGSDASPLHILPKTQDPRKGVLFLSVPSDKLLGMFQKAGLLDTLDISTNEQFFDSLGKLPENNQALEKIRKLMNINTASGYTKTSKGKLHAYWIQSSAESQNVYFK